MSPAATIDAAEGERAVLAAADDLFYNRGVAAVTMSDIRDRSRVSLRRLYSTYPSKSDLVSAWLRHRHDAWMTDFVGRVEGRVQNGDTPVDAVFAALEAWMTETGFRGCGFINTHAEANDLTDEQRVIIRSHKAALASYLATLIPEGEAVAVIVDGAIVQAAIFGTSAPIHHAHRAAAALTRQDVAA
jgi:AcrR family transcriptional regulator